MEPFIDRCPNGECGASRPQYTVYNGPCGLSKNPCLHPRSYKYFEAVPNGKLDQLFDGECLLFSTKSNCKTSPVFEMSGADLDGDDFLIITQKDLLPRPDINDVVPPQNFDEQGEMKLPDYIDDDTMVLYFLEYSLYENTSELSTLHEAFSEHHEEGIGHPDCLKIAKYHSYALDFAKTGKAAVFKKEEGIPMMKEVMEQKHVIYPHYMCRSLHNSFRSTMIKGRFYDFVVSQIPNVFMSNAKFRRESNLQRVTPDASRPNIKRNGGNQEDRNALWYAANSYNAIPNENAIIGVVQNGNEQVRGQSAVQPLALNHHNVPINQNVAINQNESAQLNVQSESIAVDPVVPVAVPVVDAAVNNINPNPMRHENVDIDDFEDEKIVENADSAVVIGDRVNDQVEDDMVRPHGNVENENDMEWIEETEYKQLYANIEDIQVREYLRDTAFLDIATINHIREQLTAFRSNAKDGSKAQWEAFHLDMYYELALQQKRQQLRVDMNLSDSDNVNENEDEKRSSFD